MRDVQAQNLRITVPTRVGTLSGAGGRDRLAGYSDRTFEYFGTDTQQVGAKNYEHLLLTGSGSIKKTTSSDVNILSTVAVASGVKFDISSTMTLINFLAE